MTSQILEHDPLALYLMVLALEWGTQRHYVESIHCDGGSVDPLYVEILKAHWIEEATFQLLPGNARAQRELAMILRQVAEGAVFQPPPTRHGQQRRTQPEGLPGRHERLQCSVGRRRIETARCQNGRGLGRLLVLDGLHHDFFWRAPRQHLQRSQHRRLFAPVAARRLGVDDLPAAQRDPRRELPDDEQVVIGHRHRPPQPHLRPTLLAGFERVAVQQRHLGHRFGCAGMEANYSRVGQRLRRVGQQAQPYVDGGRRPQGARRRDHGAAQHFVGADAAQVDGDPTAGWRDLDLGAVRLQPARSRLQPLGQDFQFLAQAQRTVE